MTDTTNDTNKATEKKVADVLDPIAKMKAERYAETLARTARTKEGAAWVKLHLAGQKKAVKNAK